MASSAWRLYVLAVVASAVGGCGARDQSTAICPVVGDRGPQADLLDEASRTHHFGAVVSGSGRKLTHIYRLVNAGEFDVKLVKLINRKPCCGEVRVDKTVLHPRDGTDIEVTLFIRQEFGDVVHEVVVLTEPPQRADLVLRTTASAYPPFRVEELTPIGGSGFLTSLEPKAFELRVSACGSVSDPPFDLDCVELRSSIGVEWNGLKEETPAEEGLKIESRRLSALLDCAGAPGHRKAEIAFHGGAGVFYTYALSWETLPHVTASPKIIVIRPHEHDYRILMQSRDHNLFRVTGVECDVSGLRGKASATSAPSLTQLVEIKRDGVEQAPHGRGVITIFTDHPVQGKVELPFLTLD